MLVGIPSSEKKEFIHEGGSGRIVELEEVQNVQSIQKQQVDSLQVDPQPDVPIAEAQPLHTPPFRRLSA